MSKENEVVRPILNNLGSLIFATSLLALIWELFVRRHFVQEILEKVGTHQSVVESGMLVATLDFQDIKWSKYFEKSRNLDIYFAYGRTWRGHNAQHLKKLSLQEKSIVRVILPDVDDDNLIANLSIRFGYTNDKTRDEILNSAKDFFEIFSGKKAKFELYYCKRDPMYSMYLFDYEGVFSMYKLKKERGNIPSFVLKEGGELYGFLREEFNYLVDNSEFSRRVVSV